MAPVITVITCTIEFDSGFWRTIESLRIQHFKSFEVIVVSRYGSSEVDKVHNVPAFVRLVKDKGSGLYAAMNQGINEARGKYCIFLNAGDELSCENSLSILCQSIGENDWCYGGISVIDESGLRRDLEFHKFSRRKLLASLSYVPHPSTIVKTTVIRQLGGFKTDIGISADQEFFSRLSFTSKPKITEKIITKFYLGGMSSRTAREIFDEYRMWARGPENTIILHNFLNAPILLISYLIRSLSRHLTRYCGV